MRPLAALVALALVATPLAGSLPGLPAPDPTAPGLGAVPPALLAAAHARDAPGLLLAIAAYPEVSPAQQAVMRLLAEAHARPTLDRMVALGELHFLGAPLGTPSLDALPLREALLGLYDAAGATPSAAALGALAELEALPREAQEALAFLAAAQTYALGQVRLAYAGLDAAERAELLQPFPDPAVQAKVRWAPLFLALRAQLAAADAAAPVLGRLPAQPVVMADCGVVRITTDFTDDLVACDHVLSVDAGGDDRYVNNAGGTGASGALGAALLLDLRGDDRYEPLVTGTAGVVGGGVLGTGVLYDALGADVYQPQVSQPGMQGPVTGLVGGGSQGLGALVDRAGMDRYIVHGAWYAGALGGGRAGHGLLLDDGLAPDVYEADLESAGGGIGGADRGSGFLVDMGGDDFYMGMLDTRVGVEGGFNGGNTLGKAALFDYGGDDVYIGEFMGGSMGSGGANGGSLGLDSAGVLVDNWGDDVYFGMGMMDSEVNGAAGVAGLGVLIDLEGNDHASGVADMTGAVNGGSDNGVGIFVNVGGDDTYDALFCNPGTGGVNGGAWAGVGLLLDLGGSDLYREAVEHHHHHHMMGDSMELMCMMMPMSQEAGGSGWRRDTVQLAKGIGEPVNLPTGAQVDDTARELLPPSRAGITGDVAPGTPGQDMVRMLQPDPGVMMLFVDELGDGERPALGSYELRGPVAIRGPADFTAANGVRSGSGTAEDPYVISGWLFTGALAPDAPAALLLEGTAAHVVVRDNLFLEPVTEGLTLRGARNVLAERNACVLATQCFVLAQGSEAVFRHNLALRAGYGFGIYDSMARMERNDVVGNGEGVYYINARITGIGNEFLKNRDSIIGRDGTLFLRENNFRLSGSQNFNMRNALMISNTEADVCLNWWSHPAGPMVMGMMSMGPLEDPTPEGIVHWFEHMAMMAWPYGGEMVMTTNPLACVDPWLTAPSAEAGWML